jgi:alpha-tubulin suppressor-like RCC1 family protein
MSGFWAGRSGSVRRWLALGLVLLIPFLLMLVWTTSVPARTLGALEDQPQPVFSAGWYHSLAIRSDGSLWSWGYNHYGQLGDDTTTDRDAPVRIGTPTGWSAVVAAGNHSLALRSDGSLWAWGHNRYGQLGDGTTTDRHKPTRIGTSSNWAAIAARNDTSLAIRSDGSLWAWGSNDRGQLGDGTTTDRTSPRRIGTDRDWVAVSAGNDHCIALKADGSLWTWGWNEYGQLGLGSTQDRAFPTRVGSGRGWVAVAAGSFHSLALRADGTMWACGMNHNGQIGDGTTTDALTFRRIGTNADWVAIAAGYDDSLALKADGSLWVWGMNGYTGLQTGYVVGQAITPTRAGTDSDWRATAASYEFSLALKSNGTLLAWGKDDRGQLGVSGETFKDRPVQCLNKVKFDSSSFGFASSSTTTSTTTTTTTGSTTSSSTTASSTTSSTTTSTSTTSTSLPPAATFPDVPDTHPYHDAISYLADEGIVAGREDGTFGPDAPVTRQQFAKMIVKTLGYPVTGTEVCPFVDITVQEGIDPLYPSKYVAVCAAHGITVGKTATTFAPRDAITHQQLITMVARAAGLSDPPPSYAPPFTASQFTLPDHYANARKAAHAGLLDGLRGVGAGYDFLAPSTRGECAQLLYNMARSSE